MRRRLPASLRPLVEGLAAFLVVFLAAELIRLPPRVAIAVSALAALAVIYRAPLLAYLRGAVVRPEPPSALTAVLARSDDEIARLNEAKTQVADAGAAVLMGELAEAAGEIVSQARAGALEPRLGARVLSYYLPRAADLADAWAGLEDRGDAARLEAARTLMSRLLTVFRDAAQGLSEEALKTLDVDMRLLDQALEDERPGRR